MKKIFFIILISTLSVFADEIKITKYIFFTLEGSIDKYPITINIKAVNPNDIKLGKKIDVSGYYKYSNINIPIPINGEIDKNGIRFYAFGEKEEFNFKMDSRQLENIINLGNSEKNIDLKGDWKNNNKKLSLSIKTIKPLGDKIYTVYDIHVCKEYKNNTYGLSAVYIENLKSYIYGSSIIKQINNTNEVIKKINDDIDKSDWKKEEIFNEDQFYSFERNYFNDNILCFGSSIEYYHGGPYPDASISYFTLDINKLEIKILTLSDFVYDSGRFRDFLQNDINEYYKDYDDIAPNIIKDEPFSRYAESLMSNNVSIVNGADDDIKLLIKFDFPHAIRAFDDYSISFDKLKPYLKKNIY
ncbi:hypothetical protein [uncultured Brachyspira sp.]|uniref:hypothetical protein n=1 Tax=uncultured Brachyspira sp. TaxID=221953 RepID=UPI0025F17901|nr:hypothetical protein [uncultured Brachyspira sp.]